ncbi:MULTISPECIES: hypothetical protein [Protofrankia]|uniref:hypothetical protein n=1 Tax=Protofrankia TaxID=2994361 RepID=UPI000681779B|nr:MULTISPECIES: hypothetical protein [Protofrankia]
MPSYIVTGSSAVGGGGALRVTVPPRFPPAVEDAEESAASASPVEPPHAARNAASPPAPVPASRPRRVSSTRTGCSADAAVIPAVPVG